MTVPVQHVRQDAGDGDGRQVGERRASSRAPGGARRAGRRRPASGPAPRGAQPAQPLRVRRPGSGSRPVAASGRRRPVVGAGHGRRRRWSPSRGVGVGVAVGGRQLAGAGGAGRDRRGDGRAGDRGRAAAPSSTRPTRPSRSTRRTVLDAGAAVGQLDVRRRSGTTTMRLGATRYGPSAPDTCQFGKYDVFTSTGHADLVDVEARCSSLALVDVRHLDRGPSGAAPRASLAASSIRCQLVRAVLRPGGRPTARVVEPAGRRAAEPAAARRGSSTHSSWLSSTPSTHGRLVVERLRPARCRRPRRRPTGPIGATSVRSGLVAGLRRWPGRRWPCSTSRPSAAGARRPGRCRTLP